MKSRSNIYIGPAGWSYPDWKGIVYPVKKSKDFSELLFIARYFNTIEINSTFYRLPSLQSVENWSRVRSINPDFLFVVKLWQRFTHTDAPISQEEADRFRQAIDPLQKKNILGSLLIQFPWRFKNSSQAIERVLALKKTFRLYPVNLEFRHGSWNDPKTISILKENDLGFVNIDQPLIGKSLPRTVFLTSSTGYFRMHGQNRENWFKENSGRDARYNYLYSQNELETLISDIKKVADKAERTFIIFNNHFRGQAVVNGLQMMAKLYQTNPKVPVSLLRTYPLLSKTCVAENDGMSMDLFS